MILFKVKLDYSKPFSANTDLAYSVISSAVSIVSTLFATSSHSALETERKMFLIRGIEEAVMENSSRPRPNRIMVATGSLASSPHIPVNLPCS